MLISKTTLIPVFNRSSQIAMIGKAIQQATRTAASFERSTIKLLRRPASSYPMDIKAETSGLYKIDEFPNNPFLLFKKWYNDHQSENYIATNSLCLSTATKNGIVSSRNLILRRLDEDGFVIMTDSRSKKSKELSENPCAAMAFLWIKENDGLIHSRQVRVEGDMKQLPVEDSNALYNNEPLFAKIRAYLCDQGQKVDWTVMKQHHDELLQQFKDGKNDLPKPDHVITYKMMPKMIEFYESKGPQIADRVMYLLEKDSWQPSRIAA